MFVSPHVQLPKALHDTGIGRERHIPEARAIVGEIAGDDQQGPVVRQWPQQIGRFGMLTGAELPHQDWHELPTRLQHPL